MLIYVIAIQCAVVAYTYSEILISEGHIMYPFHKWLTAKLTSTLITELPAPPEVADMPGYTPVKHIKTKKSPLLKPLGDCPLCMAGQLTLWTVVFHFLLLPYLPKLQSVLSFVTLLIFTICFSILCVLLMKKLIEKWSR
jgi:hypothetical protein